MTKIFFSHSFTLSLFLLCSCGRNQPGPGHPGDRVLGPDAVNISGIRLGSTSGELRALLPAVRCVRNEPEEDVCTWIPGVQERKGRFRGVERIRCEFHRDFLRTIRIEYAEMLDLEFSAFDTEVREKYGYLRTGKAPDSVFTEWRYDSLVVSLTPNRRPHWTGRITTFTPVLEFVSR